MKETITISKTRNPLKIVWWWMRGNLYTFCKWVSRKYRMSDYYPNYHQLTKPYDYEKEI